MYETGLMELELISRKSGKHSYYVQGGGGNTSVKLDDEWMAVKASGFRLVQVTKTDGFAVVNYKKASEYIGSVDFKSGIDYEKDSIKFISKNQYQLPGIKMLRPSVEAGFHSVLKKYVIHTHPVFANILCCIEDALIQIDRILKGTEVAYMVVPYIKPGFSLSYKIKQEIDNYNRKNGKFPDVIFMENHGLIANHDDATGCIDLHKKVNEIIRSTLNISDNYPQYTVSQQNEKLFSGKTEFVSESLKKNDVQNNDFFNNFALYPDRLVYINEALANGKMKIDYKTYERTYSAKRSEAETIEETLTAYFYVIENINKCGFKIKPMPEEETEYIKNWEVEKFRREVSAGKDK